MLSCVSKPLYCQHHSTQPARRAGQCPTAIPTLQPRCAGVQSPGEPPPCPVEQQAAQALPPRLLQLVQGVCGVVPGRAEAEDLVVLLQSCLPALCTAVCHLERGDSGKRGSCIQLSQLSPLPDHALWPRARKGRQHKRLAGWEGLKDPKRSTVPAGRAVPGSGDTAGAGLSGCCTALGGAEPGSSSPAGAGRSPPPSPEPAGSGHRLGREGREGGING